MPTYTADDVVKLEVPADLDESLIIRCTEKKFAPSSKGDPMITCNWEIVGISDGKGGVDNKIRRTKDGQTVEYVIGGLRLRPTWHVITKKSLFFFQKWWSKCTGIDPKEFKFDSENPDLDFLNKLVMSAQCGVEVKEARKKLTDEEKEKLKAEGQELKGEIIIDDATGQAKTYNEVYVKNDGWNGRFTGELPAF